MNNLKLIAILACASYIFPLCCYVNADEFRNCSILYNCGSLRGIGYPFLGGDRPDDCGRQVYRLDCENGVFTGILIDRIYYRVLGIDPSIPKMTIAQSHLWGDVCPNSWSFFNYYKSFNFNFNDPARNVRKLRIFYGCSSEVISRVQVKSNVTCTIDGERGGVFFAHEVVPVVGGCRMNLVVPIQMAAYDDLWDGKITLQEALKQGFDVQYTADLAACSSCEASGGKCGSDSYDQFRCFCQDKTHGLTCGNHGKTADLAACSSCEASGGKCGSDSYDQFRCFCQDKTHGLTCGNHGKKRSVKLVIGASVTALGILSCLIICYSCHKKCILFMRTRKADDGNELEAFIKLNDPFKARRYSYNEIKKMTNHFKEKIGQGGYGEVYKGNLSDKSPVAVKILSSTKENAEEFINEISTISKTSHVNVVTLLGFSLDGLKRALIYEFMPNGSLEKYIHPESDAHLGLERLYEIAIGIAKGLEYLHGGCNTRILHFDIKPHNILLDEDFCPKISDFGLSKLCPRKESIVSMLGARGTIGYIAPEVFSRNFGRVSYKSDVYSYGMMVLEMVLGRNTMHTHQMSNASETYFPDWVYDRILIREDLNLHGHGMTEEENDIARKMILVGLWCIQTNPLQRPTMNKVIDMLEGNSQSLEVPPKPFLCSPSRSEAVNLEMSVLPPMTMSSFSRSESYSYTTSA